MTVQEDHPLRAFNTFGIEARADRFVTATSLADVQAVLRERPDPFLVLGGGSNVLLTQKRYPGTVLRIAIGGIAVVRQDEAHVWVRAGAGVVWHDLVEYCLAHHYAGMENLSLIPGTVGASPMQNIGAYGVEVKDIFEELEAVALADATVHTFDGPACQFGYRDSVFKREAKGQFIITSVTFRLRKQPVFNVSYGAIRSTLAEMGVEEADLTIRKVSEAVIRIRQSKLPDPAQIGNAGSFFKNPEIPAATFEALRTRYPDVPGYPTAPEQVKVPAGWLIEQCGFKGKRFGAVGVHDQQALVLVNRGGAKGADVRTLAQTIQQTVAARFGIALSPEVNFV